MKRSLQNTLYTGVAAIGIGIGSWGAMGALQDIVEFNSESNRIEALITKQDSLRADQVERRDEIANEIAGYVQRGDTFPSIAEWAADDYGKYVGWIGQRDRRTEELREQLSEVTLNINPNDYLLMLNGVALLGLVGAGARRRKE